MTPNGVIYKVWIWDSKFSTTQLRIGCGQEEWIGDPFPVLFMFGTPISSSRGSVKYTVGYELYVLDVNQKEYF